MTNYEIMSICNKNRIFIYPVPVKDSEGNKWPKVHLELKYPNKKPKKTRETYSQNSKLTRIILNKFRDIYIFHERKY